jgi:membrane protein
MINLAAQFAPGSQGIIEANTADIIRLRGTFGIIGVIGLLWSGSGVFSAVTHAINKAWNINYEHPFYIKKPREILMLLVAGLLFLLSFGATTLFSQIGSIGLPFSGAFVNIGTVVVAFIFSLIVITLTHKFAPIVWVGWRHIWPGAALSTVLFEIAKTFFVLYLNNFNNYDKIYGSIESVIVLLVWIYFSAFILLFGAEFSALLFRIKRDGEITLNKREKYDLIRD